MNEAGAKTPALMPFCSFCCVKVPFSPNWIVIWLASCECSLAKSCTYRSSGLLLPAFPSCRKYWSCCDGWQACTCWSWESKCRGESTARCACGWPNPIWRCSSLLWTCSCWFCSATSGVLFESRIPTCPPCDLLSLSQHSWRTSSRIGWSLWQCQRTEVNGCSARWREGNPSRLRTGRFLSGRSPPDTSCRLRDLSCRQSGT